tara:strand:+ start:780 stop:1109 length:330 start_codon:yes stop_codon:yes gene_type:complete
MAYGNAPQSVVKEVKVKKKVPKGSHRMPDGKIMKDSAMKKKKQSPLKLDLKEGTFTRMAKDKGYGSNVQKFAKDIMKFKDKGSLPNGQKITKLMVKKANFVVVSKNWDK